MYEGKQVCDGIRTYIVYVVFVLTMLMLTNMRREIEMGVLSFDDHIIFIALRVSES